MFKVSSPLPFFFFLGIDFLLRSPFFFPACAAHSFFLSSSTCISPLHFCAGRTRGIFSRIFFFFFLWAGVIPFFPISLAAARWRILPFFWGGRLQFLAKLVLTIFFCWQLMSLSSRPLLLFPFFFLSSDTPLSLLPRFSGFRVRFALLFFFKPVIALWSGTANFFSPRIRFHLVWNEIFPVVFFPRRRPASFLTQMLTPCSYTFPLSLFHLNATPGTSHQSHPPQRTPPFKRGLFP